MRYLLFVVLVAFTLGSVADTQVPHFFTDGTPAKASEVNANFDKLEDAIDNIPDGATGADGATGPAGADGADGVAAGLNCTTDQVIVYRGGAWVCSSPVLVWQAIFADFGEANCASDKKVTGGGCNFGFLDDCDRTMSSPKSDLSGWQCQSFSLGGFVCEVERAYAICQ